MVFGGNVVLWIWLVVAALACTRVGGALEVKLPPESSTTSSTSIIPTSIFSPTSIASTSSPTLAISTLTFSPTSTTSTLTSSISITSVSTSSLTPATLTLTSSTSITSTLTSSSTSVTSTSTSSPTLTPSTLTLATGGELATRLGTARRTPGTRPGSPTSTPGRQGPETGAALSEDEADRGRGNTPSDPGAGGGSGCSWPQTWGFSEEFYQAVLDTRHGTDYALRAPWCSRVARQPGDVTRSHMDDTLSSVGTSSAWSNLRLTSRRRAGSLIGDAQVSDRRLDTTESVPKKVKNKMRRMKRLHPFFQHANVNQMEAGWDKTEGSIDRAIFGLANSDTMHARQGVENGGKRKSGENSTRSKYNDRSRDSFSENPSLDTGQFVECAPRRKCQDQARRRSRKFKREAWTPSRDLKVLGHDEESEEGEVITLGVLLPYNNSRLFSVARIAPAIFIALDEVRRRRLLPGRKVRIHIADSNCSISTALNAAIEFYINRGVTAFLGPVCDYAVAPVARQARFWGVPVLTPGALAWDFLAHRAPLYRSLTRLGASFHSLQHFLLTALQEFGWRRVKLMYNPEGQAGVATRLCHVASDGIYRGLVDSRVGGQRVEVEYFKFDTDHEGLAGLATELGTRFASQRRPFSSQMTNTLSIGQVWDSLTFSKKYLN